MSIKVDGGKQRNSDADGSHVFFGNLLREVTLGELGVPSLLYIYIYTYIS